MAIELPALPYEQNALEPHILQKHYHFIMANITILTW